MSKFKFRPKQRFELSPPPENSSAFLRRDVLSEVGGDASGVVVSGRGANVARQWQRGHQQGQEDRLHRHGHLVGRLVHDPAVEKPKLET